MPDAEFDSRVMSAIRAYANFVHLLPASEHEHFRGAGGLLRYGLEVAFHSLQACDGVIFSAKEPVERRRLTETRWRYATFLAALCSELYVPLTSMVVVDAKGRQWPSHQVPLAKWLADEKIDRYWVRWITQSGMDSGSKGAAAFVLPLVLPPDAMDYLKEAGGHVGTAMLSVITSTPSPHEQLPIAEVVSNIRAKIRDRDLKIQPSLYGRLTVGTHLEPILLDAMRTLWRTEKWQVNEKKARLWYRDDGLYLVWGNSTYKDLASQFDDINGVPRDEATILDILINANIINTHGDGNPYWEIESNGSSKLRCVRFTNPYLLFGDSANQPTPIIQSQKAEQRLPDDAVSVVAQGEAPDVASVASESSPATPGNPAEVREQFVRPSPQEAKTNTAEKSDPSKVLQELDKVTAEVMKAISEDIRKKKVPAQSVGKCSLGYGISLEVISSYGVDATTIVAKLEGAGWLAKDPAAPRRKLVNFDLAGVECLGIVLTADIVKGLGLE